jgi:signal transduction histidine kinase
MGFIVRSLWGKLIVLATFILLLCMLLFVLLSWYLLTFYSEHEARNTAQSQLFQIKQEYQLYTTTLRDELHRTSANTAIINATATMQSSTSQALQDHLQSLLVQPLTGNHLSILILVSKNHQVLAQLNTLNTASQNIASTLTPLADKDVQGQTLSSLQKYVMTDNNSSGTVYQWLLSVAVPIQDSHGHILGTLLGGQVIDDTLAQTLAQKTGMSLLLCVEGQIEGRANLSPQNTQNSQKLCTAGALNTWNGSQRTLTLAGTGQAANQAPQSPSLILVASEPLYTIAITNMRLFPIIAGVGLFIFGICVMIYTFMIRKVFIQPLHQLQNHVQSLVASSAGEIVPPNEDELMGLAQSYSLLADCIENEGQVMTEQMTNLLIMSDAFISTLNLEQLLGEIVSRMGNIMKAKNVTLLLYGREMLSPSVVAQWSEMVGQVVASYSMPTSSFTHTLQQQGAVTVHADLDGDITMAITSKMAAISNNQLSEKQKTVHGEKPGSGTQPYGIRRPRIPRSALRDLDMILARMVMQRHKIAYGEDIKTIYQERKEKWAKMALEAGYQSAISVPLLFHDQAIGAFIIYSDKPRQISSRDTFLLSTAAAQASVAIQNALLFVEVKEKNAALERASHLKSQFLANVTHELRTPLHSIISYGSFIVEGFVEGELTGEQEEHIQFMVNRAEDLSHLVDDMLDLSKIEADHIEVKIEEVELHDCLMEVVNQLKPLANKKDLYLDLEMGEGVKMVLADSYRLRQVVINLASNALKFTEKGGVTIHCTLVNAQKMAQIAVSDTGIGISPSALEYIFEAFRQADGSTTRRFGGTGLGLTIARKLIELQGGEVAVESVPGQGSIFSFTLPVKP